MYYYNRVLSDYELLYVNRARQKIAKLAEVLTEESSRFDPTFEYIQLSIELQYTIDLLSFSGLDWTEVEILSMIDFYTLRANLYEYEATIVALTTLPASLIYPDTGTLIGRINQLEEELHSCCTTVSSELIRIEEESKERDLAIGGGGGVNAVLVADLLSAIDVGGIKYGDNFPAGTTLEEIWKSLLGAAAEISSLTHSTFETPLEVGTLLTITEFSWINRANVQNLRLRDDKGILVDQAVAGQIYTPTPPLNYNILNEEITWTLTGDAVAPTTMKIAGRYKSFWGKNVTVDDTPITINSAHLALADNGNTSKVVFTATEITVPLITNPSEQGWIAVPAVNNVIKYTNWFVTNDNSSKIAVDDFILPAQHPAVTYNGVVYNVYRWRYRSPLLEPIKLFNHG